MDYTTASRKDIMLSWIATDSLNEKLEQYFDSERNQWDEEKQGILKLFSSQDMEVITSELQSNNLAFRSRCQERISSTMVRYSKENNKLKKIAGDRREYYLTNFGVKTSDNQMKELLQRDLSESQRNLQIIETHIEYLRENMKWSDQIGYAIKNRVEIKKNYIMN